MADRTRDVGDRQLRPGGAANPDTNLFEIEQELRDAAAQTYLIATPGTAAGFEVVLGTLVFRRRVAAAGITVEQNRAALTRMPA